MESGVGKENINENNSKREQRLLRGAGEKDVRVFGLVE
ncbi:MAG: hypothetical protein ACI8ZB_003640 [Desulforhopalus sp.]|jgi:hypothetical protein